MNLELKDWTMDMNYPNISCARGYHFPYLNWEGRVTCIYCNQDLDQSIEIKNYKDE